MRSNASTIEDYLAELPEEHREALIRVRDIILANLPPGYQEVMNWGMITYEVPLAFYPDTYNKKPLMYAALASQKNYMALYLTGIYINPDNAKKFEHAYQVTGKRYDCGKSCAFSKTGGFAFGPHR